ncbi:hypothetical protein Drose_06350 [Dactylosporangium roseum]|uniref:Uncharacterized protein n=1 Tax=Dactylosporangium roseum TaxID=47989 RepID=A0ABY5ZB22_9ACTN|nr:hypothetical protein [Dactylosporangium roseum]UWZ37893.1 hypothetical protein Drose_06350 [Dactylosporangium roseum]
MSSDDALESDLRRVAATVDAAPPVVLPCCDMHNRFCEPPGDMCCRGCAEAAHPGHLDGSACVIGRPR